MNSSKDYEQVNFNSFNCFSDQDDYMRDPNLNYFNDLNSNNFDITCVLEKNVKRHFWDTKKYENLSEFRSVTLHSKFMMKLGTVY